MMSSCLPCPKLRVRLSSAYLPEDLLHPSRPPLPLIPCHSIKPVGAERTEADNLSIPEVLSLRRVCIKDQSWAVGWAPLIGACRRMETLIVARNVGSWDDILVDTLGQGKAPELSQV